MAAEEASAFKRAGGQTVVDLTGARNGRDPLAIQEIARETGLNIIIGTGHYIAPFPPDMDARTQDRLTSEITVGVGDTGVRAGIIDEIGTSSPITTNEQKSVRAAAARAGFDRGHTERAPRRMGAKACRFSTECRKKAAMSSGRS